MEVRIHSRGTSIGERIRVAAVEKLEHAAKVFENQVGDLDVEFSEAHNPRLADERYRVEVTTSAAGHVVRVAGAAKTAESAIDVAVDRLNQQLRRLKEKLIESHRKPGLKEAVTEREVESSNEIVRVKQFVMKPMTLEEATLQMELLGHDFFFFQRDDNLRPSVLYRRRDGRLGLIESA